MRSKLHLESNSNARQTYARVYSAPHGTGCLWSLLEHLYIALRSYYTDVAGRSLTFGARVFQISQLSGLSFIRLVGRQLLLAGAGVGSGSLSVSRAGLGPVHAHHSPLRFAEAEQLPRTECPVGWLWPLLATRGSWGGHCGWRRRSGCHRRLFLHLWGLQELEKARELCLTSRWRLRWWAWGTGGELPLQRDDLFQLHHVVVSQQRAGSLGLFAKLARRALVVVVLVLGVRLVVVALLAGLGLQLCLTVELLLLTPASELLLEMLLSLLLVFLNGRAR